MTTAAPLVPPGFSGCPGFLARRPRPRAPWIPIGIALLLSAAASSQVLPTKSESVVVTATATPEEQVDLGAATTVITRAQIEKNGWKTVADVLRSVPGLDVSQYGGEGQLTSVFLRGANSNDTLLLVDGVRMNSPYFSGYDFSSLTTENIERIEIARGPFSALYGSDAMGGVIQVFTRPGASGFSGRASLEAGNVGEREGEVFASAGSGPWSAPGSFRDGRIDGDRRNSDWQRRSGPAHSRASSAACAPPSRRVDRR